MISRRTIFASIAGAVCAPLSFPFAKLMGAPPKSSFTEQKPLLKDIGMEMTWHAFKLANHYFPRPDNPNSDEARFFRYSKMAIEGAAEFANYESPKLGSVLDLDRAIIG
jgi:hypothetical protein